MACKDEKGNVYGLLTVLERDYSKKGSHKNAFWKCKCQCGKETIVIGSKLRNGETKSCGCLRKQSTGVIDLVGQKFGLLTVIQRDGSSPSGTATWFCNCDCGNKNISVIGANLRSGHTTSCGCKHKMVMTRTLQKDISNNRFGKLVALYPTEKRRHTNTIWYCKCDCGQFCEADINSLTQNKTKSCGCLGKSYGEFLIAELLMQNDIPFETQKTFSTCRFPDTNALAKFDFYVNNQYLIEFDGIQHFEYKNDTGWNNKENFEKTQYRDNYKNQWCKNNGISLIRIPYYILNNLTIKDLLKEESKWLKGN